MGRRVRPEDFSQLVGPHKLGRRRVEPGLADGDATSSAERGDALCFPLFRVKASGKCLLQGPGPESEESIRVLEEGSSREPLFRSLEANYCACRNSFSPSSESSPWRRAPQGSAGTAAL